jgi:hypothetical protein
MAKYGKPQTQRLKGFFPRIDIMTASLLVVERLSSYTALFHEDSISKAPAVFAARWNQRCSLEFIGMMPKG